LTTSMTKPARSRSLLKKNASGFLILLLLTLVPVRSMAGVSLTLHLDRSEATLADTVTMVVKISGTRSGNIRPVLHGLEEFTVGEGGTSSRVEIINGRVNAGIDYTYFLQPKKVGRFELGPAEIQVEGKVLTSNIATLEVKAPAQRSGADRGPLFLEAEVSTHDLFVEEQCIYTLKLYRRIRVRDPSLSLPKVEHIVFKQLGEPIEYQSTYGGLDYRVLEIRYALLPAKEGDYVLGPSTMQMTVLQADNRSPFGRFFNDPFFSFSPGRPQTLTTQPLELKVHPLPEEGKPADFSGLVGDFRMESKLEPSGVRAGESATLTVSVTGRGNANRIPDLKIPEMNHTKIYADQPVLEMKEDEKGLGGTKVMKWALVPERPGKIEVPSLRLSFFDAQRGEYRVLNTPSYTLSVLPGEKEAVVASTSLPGSRDTKAGPVKQEIKELGKDILPIHTGIKDLSVSNRAFMKGPAFYLALLGPFSLYMMAFCALKLRKRSPALLNRSRSRNASKELIKQCRRGGLSANHLMDAVKDYMNNRFNLSIGALTADEAAKVFERHGVRVETAEKMRSLIRKLEDAVYTGKGEERTEAGKDLPALVKAMEKEIR